jgi:hypothetical protein
MGKVEAAGGHEPRSFAVTMGLDFNSHGAA